MKNKTRILITLLTAVCLITTITISAASQSSVSIPKTGSYMEYGYDITTEHHDAVYETVHHDAEYETIHHEAEYEIIHHDAVYETEPCACYSQTVKAKPGKTVSAKKLSKKAKTGLLKKNGKWKYYEKGKFSKKTGLAKRSDGKWVYVRDGIPVNKTGLVKKVKDDNKLYYVKNGKLNNFTGIVKTGILDGYYYGVPYYIKNGVSDRTFSGFVQNPNGKVYEVEDGIAKLHKRHSAKQVLVREAWDEQGELIKEAYDEEVFKEAYDEQVLVQEAYDEVTGFVSQITCNDCDKGFFGYGKTVGEAQLNALDAYIEHTNKNAFDTSCLTVYYGGEKKPWVHYYEGSLEDYPFAKKLKYPTVESVEQAAIEAGYDSIFIGK